MLECLNREKKKAPRIPYGTRRNSCIGKSASWNGKHCMEEAIGNGLCTGSMFTDFMFCWCFLLSGGKPQKRIAKNSVLSTGQWFHLRKRFVRWGTLRG